MAETNKQFSSPITRYLFSRQSAPFSPHTWQPPILSEAYQIPLQFNRQIRPALNVQTMSYIAVNQSLELGQESIDTLQRSVWDQTRGPNRFPVVSQSHGRPILGMHNQVTANNIVEKPVNAKNGVDKLTGSSNYPRDYSNALKRPRPCTPLNLDNPQNNSQNGSGSPPRKFSHTQHNRHGMNSSMSAFRISPQHQENRDCERNFKPVATSPSKPVELNVTNLDHSIDSTKLKEVLLLAFKEHVKVLHILIFVTSDGNLAASVRVPSVQDAQYAISQLHRRRIGQTRIMISYASSGSTQNSQIIRSQIYSLLLEVPGNQLPLFAFQNLFESKYLTSISVSELYRMRDVCIITEEGSSRKIYLNPKYKNSPSPQLTCSNIETGQPSMELLYCQRHGIDQELKGWAEQELPSLPNVRVRLSEFNRNIQTLIQTHNDFLPLASIMNCYAAEFGSIEVDETGVPLEYLVSWVPNIDLAVNLGYVKYLRSAVNKPQLEKPEDKMKKCSSPPLAKELSLFSRELVDLLRTQPKNNQLMFNRFIPAYHHRFGRQCRVADYGFTKLIDLLEALPQVIQVIGEGNMRVIMLSNRIQIRRFTSDFLRVLKLQPNKQLKVSELSSLFETTHGRQFDPVDYGLCYTEDLLAQLSGNIVATSGTGSSMVISLPKQIQSAEEIERTKEFALKVVELLSHSPHCSMLFSKFSSAYHHHYNYQCRVSDYGFTKLIDLFEAIPHVVKISGSVEQERILTLTNDKKIIVLSNKIFDLVCANYPPGLPLFALSNAFLRQYGYALKPDVYGYDNLYQLIEKLHVCVKVENFPIEPMLMPVSQMIFLRIFRVLMMKEDAKMTCIEFYKSYQSLYESCSLTVLGKELRNFVYMTLGGVETVQLTNLQLFARNIYKLLYLNNGRIDRNLLESMYFLTFGKQLNPAQYNYQSVNELLHAISLIVIQGPDHTLILNETLEWAGIPLPQSFQKNSQNLEDVKCLQNGSSTESLNQNQEFDQVQNPPFQDQVALLRGLTNGQVKIKDQNIPSKGHNQGMDNTISYEYDNSGKELLVINLPKLATPPSPRTCAMLDLSPCSKTHFMTSPLQHSSQHPLPQACLTNSNPEPIEGNESTDSGLVTSAADLASDYECVGPNAFAAAPLSNNANCKQNLAAQFDIPPK